MPVFTDAFISDTTHLTAEETGAYTMLLYIAWQSPGCGLPNNDKKLAKWARVSPETWAAIKPNVMEFWTLTDRVKGGFWVQNRQLREFAYVEKRAETARANGKRGGRRKSIKPDTSHNPSGSSWDTQKKPNPEAPNPNPNPTKNPPTPQGGEQDVSFENGWIVLRDGEHAYWLAEFGRDHARLELALTQAANYIQPNSRKSLLVQVRAQLARQLADKKDRDGRHTKAVEANKPRPKGAPPRDFNFSNYTVHDTQDNNDPVTRYDRNTPEFMAEVDRLYCEGFFADADKARDRGWVKLKKTYVAGPLAERIVASVRQIKMAAKAD